MNKSEFIAEVAKRINFPKTVVVSVLDASKDVLVEELNQEGKMTFVGFGTFERKLRAARKGVNPTTRETINIEAKYVPTFKAGKGLKELVK